MGFNYGREKKKFDTDWKKKATWYRAVGMSEDAIQTLHAFDWEQFKSERRYTVSEEADFVSGVIGNTLSLGNEPT